MGKKIILMGVVFLIVLIAGCVQQLSRNDNLQVMRKISGKVIQTSNYCGGPPPPQELIDELRREKPFPDKELYIREGDINLLSKPIIKKFVSDKDGKFEISLTPGKYCIIEKIKKEELKIPDFTEINKQLPSYSQYRVESEQCFKDWWKNCDKILDVENQDSTDSVIKFHHRCGQPCVTGGPKPQ